MASSSRSLSLYEFSLNSVRASSLNWTMATCQTTRGHKCADLYTVFSLKVQCVEFRGISKYKSNIIFRIIVFL